MTMAMEFHDSYLRELVCGDDGCGYALFDGVVYRSEGRVFDDAQESGWQQVRFDFTEMRVEGEVVDLTYDPYANDGELWKDGANQNGVVHLPVDMAGDICLEVKLNPSFDLLKIYAATVTTTMLGEFEIETFWDADGNSTRAWQKLTAEASRACRRSPCGLRACR
jgi:hypothetical protein